MTSRMPISVVILTLVAALGIWSGCTRQSSMLVSPATTQSQGVVNSYFPAAVGKVSTLAVNNYGGASTMLTVRLGSKVPLGADSAWQWFAIRPDYSIDTDYLVITPTSVVLYEDKNSEPETILQAPLQLGESWSRFPAPSALDSLGFNSITLATDFTGGIVTKGTGDGGNPGDGNGTGKVVPITGGARASVDGVEEVVLTNGIQYSKALRIKTENVAGTSNYYWFAPAYGLVKFVLGATPTRPNGSQLGELLN